MNLFKFKNKLGETLDYDVIFLSLISGTDAHS